MNKLKTNPSLFHLLMAIIFAVNATLCFILGLINNMTNNYTESYRIYEEMKSFSTVTEVKEYLFKANEEYIIKNNKLSLKKHSIEFDIYPNFENCEIVVNKQMQMFEMLDQENYSSVKTEGKIIKGSGIIEKYTIKSSGKTYVKFNGKYSVKTYTFLIPTSAFLCGSVLLFICYGTYNKKKTS